MTHTFQKPQTDKEKGNKMTQLSDLTDCKTDYTANVDNVFLGSGSGASVTSAAYSTGVGYHSANLLASGSSITVVGFEAGNNNTTGSAITALGMRAAYAATGSNNTAVGSLALANVNTGTGNTGIGSFGAFGSSGQNISTGSNNTTVGYLADVNSGSASNRTAIGANASATADNAVQIGDSNVTSCSFGTYFTLSAATLSGVNTGDQTDATLTFSDITTNNVSTSKHGFAPKAPNDATKYLDGTGAYSRPTVRTTSITSSSTPTPNTDTTDNYTITALAAAPTFGAPTGSPVDGQRLSIRIKDNGTARALAWNAAYRAGSDLALPTTTVISKTMYVGFMYNSADSKWDCVASIGNI